MASDNGGSIDLATRLAAAIGLHEKGQLAQAQAIYDEILRIDPAHADALHLLGVIAYQQRQLGKAIEWFGKAIAANPGNAVFYVNRGIVFHELKQLEAAIADYGSAIAIKPDHIETYTNRGAAYRELKQFDAALADYGTAIALKPDHAPAYNNRGVARREIKQHEAAVADFDKAIAFKPDYAEAYNNRGLALQQRKQFAAAMADHDKAIAIKPDFAEAYYNRGVVLGEMKQFEAAIADFDKAIAIKPDYAAAYNKRGLARQQRKQLEAALADHDKAIAIRPDLAEAYNNRALALIELKRFDAAIADYGTAVSLSPDYADAYHNRGVAFHELKQLGAAIADYDKAISLRPDAAGTYWNKALTLLLAGDFEAGFKLYEWRWKHPDLNMAPRALAQPLWRGDAPLDGKTLLLHSEQGLGDTIQFCRYASLAARAGAQVILQVPPPLVGLLNGLEGVSQVLAEGEPLPPFDYHSPLLSLPLAFKTVLATVPDATPYLHADPAKRRAWQERTGERRKPRVGIVWSGGVRPGQAGGWGVREMRNIPLDAFARALNGIDIDFFSLQKGDPAEAEIRGHELVYWPRGNFHNFAGEIKDFSDTAALIANLDLVISVDTATAHLAAALGKPTWILNRFDTDWRWLLDRDDSPWYRALKLYRQDESRRWEPVLQRVAADLTKHANEPRVGG